MTNSDPPDLNDLARRRERHIGRIQAYVDAFEICTATAERLTKHGIPDDGGTLNEWSRFGHTALEAFQEMLVRLGEMRQQAIEESSLMIEEMRQSDSDNS